MLHILWILIKFILILLGILLGLVLLAVLLVLFCPVRYSAAAAKEGDSFKEAEIEARVSWLFRAIGVRFFFKNGEQKLVITLFGISLDQIRGWLDGLGVSEEELKIVLQGICYQRLIAGGGVVDFATENYQEHSASRWNQQMDLLAQSGYIQLAQAQAEKIIYR